MIETLKNTVLATLGIVAITQEKLQRLIDDLIRRGELTQEQGRVLLAELLSRGQSEKEAISQRVSQEFARLIEKMPFPTKRDLERLEERLRRLEARAGIGAEEGGDPFFEAPPAAGGDGDAAG
jgi:polyhydroxyalkanoate synthesis regulator phasin